MEKRERASPDPSAQLVEWNEEVEENLRDHVQELEGLSSQQEIYLKMLREELDRRQASFDRQLAEKEEVFTRLPAPFR